MRSTRSIDHLAASLVAEGHEEGTARALAANTIRSMAATGKNFAGVALPDELRTEARGITLRYEEARAGDMSEGVAAIARMEQAGLRPNPEVLARVGAAFELRVTVAAGLQDALDTTRGYEKAVEFLGISGAPGNEQKISGALRAVVAEERFLAEALTLEEEMRSPLAPPPGIGQVQTPVKVKPTKRSGKGKVATSPDQAYEKLHPRQRSGSPTGGQFVAKGEGMGQPNGSPRVLLLQQRLNELGFKTEMDGKFGPLTEKALKSFQKKYGLNETGHVDQDTLETMRNPPPLSVAQVKKQEAAEAKPKTKAKSTSKSTSSKSASGDEFDPQTPEEISAFQDEYGLENTGKLDAETKGAIKALNAAGEGKGSKGSGSSSSGSSGSGGGSSSDSSDSSGSGKSSGAGSTLKRGAGMKGDPDPQVKVFQQLLANIGMDLGKGGTDGRFGPDTEAAVRRFQKKNGLKVTGVVDERTLRLMAKKEKESSKAAQKEYGSSGNVTQGKGIVEKDGKEKSKGSASSGAKKVREASYQKGHTVPYGGVVPLLPLNTETGGNGARPPGDDFQAREEPVQPPGLRESFAWNACSNCVHYDIKGRCNRFTYLVDASDICNDYLTQTPPEVQRFQTGYGAAVAAAEMAEAEGDTRSVVRERVRAAYYQRKLEEFGFWNPTKHPRGRGGKWIHLGGLASDAEAASRLKPGESHNMGPGINVYRDHQHGLTVKHHGEVIARHGNDVEGAVRHADMLAKRNVAAHRDPAAYRKGRAERLGTRSSRAIRASADQSSEALMGTEIAEVKSSAYPGLDRSPRENWVDKAGGLPTYIERIAKHLHYESGKPIGHAIAIAVNVVKKMCSTGDVNFPGKQNVNPKSRAEACAAVKEWEAKKLHHALREAVVRIEAMPVPKSTVGLAFAVRTLIEIAEVDAHAVCYPDDVPEYLQEDDEERLHPRGRKGQWVKKLASTLKQGDVVKLGSGKAATVTSSAKSAPHGHAVTVRRAGGRQASVVYRPGEMVDVATGAGKAPQMVRARPQRGGKASPEVGYKGVPGALDPETARRGPVVELSPLHDGYMKTFEEMGIDHPSYFASPAAAKKAGQEMLKKHPEPIGFNTRKLTGTKARNLHAEVRGGKASPEASGPRKIVGRNPVTGGRQAPQRGAPGGPPAANTVGALNRGDEFMWGGSRYAVDGPDEGGRINVTKTVTGTKHKFNPTMEHRGAISMGPGGKASPGAKMYWESDEPANARVGAMSDAELRAEHSRSGDADAARELKRRLSQRHRQTGDVGDVPDLTPEDLAAQRAARREAARPGAPAAYGDKPLNARVGAMTDAELRAETTSGRPGAEAASEIRRRLNMRTRQSGKYSPAAGSPSGAKIPVGSVSVGTDKFTGSHGRLKNATGTWAFDIGGATVFINGTRGAATKEARQRAAAKGIRRVELLP